MRRRTFAASMVVTVSLAELACTTSFSTSNPPPPEDSGVQDADAEKPGASGDAEDPPPPATGADAESPDTSADVPKPPPEATATSTTTIELKPDGTCQEVVTTACPEGTKCNPPAPRAVDCPDDVLPKAEDPKLVTRRNDGTCWEETRLGPDACPEGVACNPPPPHRVLCPDSAYPKAKNPKNVNKRSDGSCWEFIDVKCQPGATCNPPPPQRVRCETK